MLEQVKKAAINVKNAALDLGHKANEVVHSDGFKKGVSTLQGHIKTGWDKIKNKRVKIEDKTEAKK